MTANALFLTNIICPLLSGLPLLTFAFYFFYAEQGLFRPRAKLFPLFLLSFSLYILGRPLQLLLGPVPWPQIVNSLRTILFVGICCPLVLHEARGLSGAEPHRARLRPMLTAGLSLTALYILVLIVTPSEAALIFELGPLKAYEVTMHSLTPPLFAREITILVNLLAGVGFFGLAGYETLKARKALQTSTRESRHLLYFALGCLIFGGAVLLGTVTKQWWFYYLASVPSAFFIGLGVREDMLYVRRRAEQATPFLRDELFHALGSGPKQETKIESLKSLLGKQISPTLVMTISAETSSTDDDWLTAQASAREKLVIVLDEELGEPHYLLLSVGAGRFAICLEISEPEARTLADRLRACLAADAPAGSVIAGIGGTHPPQELQHSYLEAQTALRAAEVSNQPIVSYIDLGSMPTKHRFPVEARDEFLLEFKHVHHDAARRKLQVLLDQLVNTAAGDVTTYRVRLLKLLGTILSQLEEQGDNQDVVTEAASIFERLYQSSTIDELTETFTTSIDKLQSRATAPLIETSTGGHNPLQRAKAYIDENLAEDVKVSEVARRAGVSASQLQRIFRDATGMTCSTYLTTARLTKAKELIAGTDRPITEIAFDVGYNDSNYFSTAFRKHEGITPSAYRKQG